MAHHRRPFGRGLDRDARGNGRQRALRWGRCSDEETVDRRGRRRLRGNPMAPLRPGPYRNGCGCLHAAVDPGAVRGRPRHANAASGHRDQRRLPLSRRPMKKRLSRRTFLRGASGSAFSLPLLNAVVPSPARAACAAAFPKRLFIIFTPNGTVPAEFFGQGNTTSLTIGKITAPLAPHSKDLLVLDNLDNVASSKASGDPHGVGIGCMLSGTKLLTGAAAMGMSSGGWSAGISIDQYVANTVGKSTKLASLELAGKQIEGSIFSRMSFSGPGQPVSPQPDPQLAFDPVFSTSSNQPAPIPPPPPHNTTPHPL